MIHSYLTVPATALALAFTVMSGCNDDDRMATESAHPGHSPSDLRSDGTMNQSGSSTTETQPRAADNSGQNVADRKDSSVTPFDQGNSTGDVETTRSIRKLVTDADGLSMNGRNVKIITRDGVVVLRGPVESVGEASRIVSMAHQVQGTRRVDDQLMVKQRQP